MQDSADKKILLCLRNFQAGQLLATDLSIKTREHLFISGDSGSGKSLILRAIADLIPHTGQVTLNRQTPLQLTPREWRKQVAYLSPKIVWWHQTVGEHFHSPDIEMFSSMNLDLDCLEWNTDRLSSGEQQRLGILRLLQNKPQVLLLDEPTSNLDKSNILAVEHVILNYAKHRGASTVWVSHDESQLDRIATRRYCLADGCLTESSPAKTALEKKQRDAS